MQYELRGIGPFATKYPMGSVRLTETLSDAAGGKAAVCLVLHNVLDATVKAYILRRALRILLRLAGTVWP